MLRHLFAHYRKADCSVDRLVVVQRALIFGCLSNFRLGMCLYALVSTADCAAGRSVFGTDQQLASAIAVQHSFQNHQLRASP